MTCPAKALANKIEIHLKLDDTPGYYLSKEDQQMIIDCLNFTSEYKWETKKVNNIPDWDNGSIPVALGLIVLGLIIICLILKV